MRYIDIPGQETVKSRLRKSVNEKRVPHAQLLAGPEGSGQLPLALAYISHLSCENPSLEDSCGECRNCKNIAKLVFPDLRFSVPLAALKNKKPITSEFVTEWRNAVLENPYLTLNDWYEFLGFENKQGFISADESAELVKAIALKPAEGKFRFVIIWMAEKLRTEAANRLLKSLEEPEGKNIFILISAQPDSILSTILSRVQMIRIPPLTVEDIEATLRSRFEMDQLTLSRIALLSGGNLSEALALAGKKETLAPAENDFLGWMRLCFSLWASAKAGKDSFSKLVDWIDTMAVAGREQQKSFLLTGLEFIRQCLLKNYAGSSLVIYNDTLVSNFSKFAPFINQSNYLEFEKLLSEAYHHIERNANPRILFLNLSLKINRLLNLKA
ncbi:MAG: DNA polymerase III subunit delta' [Bacteroidia bacterium]|nr:DNA polymerase III subunit delta' [Bacteroidia bacterium]